MKKAWVFSVLTFTLLFTSFAHARSCDGTAKGAAEDYMAQQMDTACADAKATIQSKHDDPRANGETRTIYEIEVQCGGDRFPHEVIVRKSDCEVLRGGGGDA